MSIRVLAPADVPAVPLPPEAFAGKTLLHFISTTVESDAVSVNFLEFEAGARSRPHSHDADQLIYYVSGEGVVAEDGGEDVIVPAGSFVVLSGGVVHMHGASSSGPATHISIMPTGHSTEFAPPIPAGWEQWVHAAREDLADHDLADQAGVRK